MEWNLEWPTLLIEFTLMVVRKTIIYACYMMHMVTQELARAQHGDQRVLISKQNPAGIPINLGDGNVPFLSRSVFSAGKKK